MKIVLFFFSLIYVSSGYSKEKPITKISQLKKIIKKTGRNHLKTDLKSFALCCKPNKAPGGKGHQEAIIFIQDYIKKNAPNLAKTMTLQEFSPDLSKAKKMYQDDFNSKIKGKLIPSHPDYKKWDHFTQTTIKQLQNYKNIKGRNVIIKKEGSVYPNEVLIIGAHYDTVSYFDKELLEVDPNGKTQGADDNASGVAIMLSMIKALDTVKTPRTIWFTFFDWETFGFLGSHAFLKKHSKELKRKKLKGFINLKMLGHDSKQSDKNKKHGNMKAYSRPNDQAFYEDFTQVSRRYERKVNFDLSTNSFDMGDHISFWEANIPALFFTQNWEDDFNKGRLKTHNDFAERVNFKTLYSSYRYIFGSTLSWLFNIYK